ASRAAATQQAPRGAPAAPMMDLELDLPPAPSARGATASPAHVMNEPQEAVLELAAAPRPALESSPVSQRAPLASPALDTPALSSAPPSRGAAPTVSLAPEAPPVSARAPVSLPSPAISTRPRTQMDEIKERFRLPVGLLAGGIGLTAIELVFTRVTGEF